LNRKAVILVLILSAIFPMATGLIYELWLAFVVSMICCIVGSCIIVIKENSHSGEKMR